MPENLIKRVADAVTCWRRRLRFMLLIRVELRHFQVWLRAWPDLHLQSLPSRFPFHVRATQVASLEIGWIHSLYSLINSMACIHIYFLLILTLYNPRICKSTTNQLLNLPASAFLRSTAASDCFSSSANCHPSRHAQATRDATAPGWTLPEGFILLLVSLTLCLFFSFPSFSLNPAANLPSNSCTIPNRQDRPESSGSPIQQKAVRIQINLCLISTGSYSVAGLPPQLDHFRGETPSASSKSASLTSS